MVEKQSKEMLNLINERKLEFIQRSGDHNHNHDDDHPGSPSGRLDIFPYPQHAPLPAPPSIDKMDIYTDPAEFEYIDQIAISVCNYMFLI